MFYINTGRSGAVVKEKELLDAMLVPPEERLTADHQLVYRFFLPNQMLKEIERTKSLNARIKCVAAMLLIPRQDFSPDIHILMHGFEDGRVIVLPKEAKTAALAFNEKVIRRKMDLLGGFSMMKSLRYDELLYLAYNLEEHACKYKDYLYREGDAPEFAFLIVQGEFHYVKDSQDHEPRIKLHRKDKEGKKRSLEEDEENPNKYVKPHIARHKIGIVEGGLGQAVGLEEILLPECQEARRYSVVCNSTQNSCVKIHRKYLETLFAELPLFQQQLEGQVKEANEVKMELFARIKLTKLTLNNNLAKSNRRFQHSQERYPDTEMRSLENKREESPLKLPIIHLKSSITHPSRERSRAYSSALAASLKSEENRHSLNSEEEENQDAPADDREHDQGGSFALTSLQVQSSKKPPRSPIDEAESSSYRTAEIRQSLESKALEGQLNLPLIGKKSVHELDGNSISLKHIVRAKPRSRLNQYGGMVDCSKLVEEKEDILERKNSRVTREEIFPMGHIDYRQPRKTSVEDPMKLNASPAHSNRFMEKMLLKVLKRAGYDETAATTHTKNLPSNATLGFKPANAPKPSNSALGHPPNSATLGLKPAVADFHRSLSKHRRRQSQAKPQKEELLVSSAFDDCYFAKI